MATLYEDAIRLIQSRDRKSPAWKRLSHDHGGAGIILGALIDVFAAGTPRSFEDLQNAVRSASASGYLSQASLYGVKQPTRRPPAEGFPFPVRSPVVPAFPGTSVAPVPVGVPIEPASAGRKGAFRVDTVPRPQDLEAPPVSAGPGITGDIAPPIPGRRPGGMSTTPSGASGMWESRSPHAVQTVSAPGQRTSRATTGSDYTRGAMLEAATGGEDLWENEILTPESSNVYGYVYDEVRGILYITYRAPLDPVGERNWTNQCTGEDYKLQVRPFVRGPMYAYGGRARPVPKWMFEELKSSSSKGSWVWDRLRVCGSFYEHQFPYNLVNPSMQGIIYTPRKATRKGFRVRAVPTVGKGRRPYAVSNLPENLFNQ